MPQGSAAGAPGADQLRKNPLFEEVETALVPEEIGLPDREAAGEDLHLRLRQAPGDEPSHACRGVFETEVAGRRARAFSRSFPRPS